MNAQARNNYAGSSRTVAAVLGSAAHLRHCLHGADPVLDIRLRRQRRVDRVFMRWSALDATQLYATRLSVICKLDKGLAQLGQFTRAARESVPQLYDTVMAGSIDDDFPPHASFEVTRLRAGKTEILMPLARKYQMA
jgi:hypothetical protein